MGKWPIDWEQAKCAKTSVGVCGLPKGPPFGNIQVIAATVNYLKKTS